MSKTERDTKERDYSWGVSELTQESYIYRGNMDHTVPIEGDSRRAQVLCDYDGLIGQFRAGTKVELHLVDGKPITILGTSNIHPDIREYTQATAFQDNGSVGGFFPSDTIGPISARDEVTTV